MPGGIGGLFNIFEIDAETMKYDAEAMAADIEQYGLYTYEELNALVPVPEVMFDAVNGQYLKVAVGKGIVTLEQIGELVERYSDLFSEALYRARNETKLHCFQQGAGIRLLVFHSECGSCFVFEGACTCHPSAADGAIFPRVKLY